jgi:phosphoglycerate dehydrogenase-like enzyme
MSRPVSLAIGPESIPGLAEALAAAGAELVEPASAEAIVWTSSGQPERLAALLEPRHRWVALVIAGVERWLAAGVVDDSRIWTCARGVYADGVAEHALALVLAAARRLPAYARAETWQQLDTERLRGETVTILGAGAIGCRLAGLLAPLGARLVAVTRHGAPLLGFERTYPSSALREALSGARYLVVTAALTDATRGIVDGAVLDALGPRGVLVNVARGELVETDALVERLRHGRLGAALLDVTDPEPLPDGHPLWSRDNVLITPHVANPNAGNPWDSHLPELLEHLAHNVRAFADHRPLTGVIDVAAGY